MKFERVERVRYAKNPLIEVICELRFPVQLAIQQALPVDFQASLASSFPFLEMAHEVQFEIHAPLGDSEAPNGAHTVRQVRTTAYEFSSVDRTVKVSLSDQWLRVSTPKYVSWEVFEAQFLDALTVLKKIYGVEYFTRIGLRYRDLIDRKILECEEVAWSDLIKPEFFGALTGYGVLPDAVDGFQQSYRLKLETGAVGITHALVRHAEERNAFLIDADFSLEEVHKTEPTDVTTILRDFNIQAGALFRATISDRLHRLLEPTTVE
jgi:uncharacterized protein (TIGR04255 family)